MPQTINCKDCGAPRETKHRNTRYCHVCRLFRNLVFVSRRTAACVSCDGRFAPIKRDDQLCGFCDFLGETHRVTGKCGVCGQKTELVRREIRVCVPCLKAPDKRQLVIKALNKRRQEQREAAEVPA